MSTSTTSTGTGERSAAEIEREVERNRARLVNTAEELKERVSPSQLADQAVEWVRSSGGREFVGNLGASVRDNPLPLLLIGTGIAWLAFGGRSEAASRARPADRFYDDLSDTGVPYGPASGAAYPAGLAEGGMQGAGGGDAGPSLGERISETAADLRERAGDLAAQAGETASEAWERAKARARGAAARVSRYGTAPGEYGGRARRSVEEMLEAQPLLIGAVGLALGAALGALLPPTEAEDRLLGEQRDRVAGRLQGLAEETYGQAREQVGEAYERGKERLQESGLTPARGAEAIGEVAREIRETVERTAEDVVNSARSGTDRPGGMPGERPGGGSPG